MSKDRRQFLKLMSALPLATVVSGCTSGKSQPEIPKPDVAPKAVEEKVESPKGPKGPDPASYASKEDLDQTRKVSAYGADMPENPQCPLTGADVKGPFHRQGAPSRAVIAGKEESGERIRVTGRVLQHDCKTPIKGAFLLSKGCTSIQRGAPPNQRAFLQVNSNQRGVPSINISVSN